MGITDWHRILIFFRTADICDRITSNSTKVHRLMSFLRKTLTLRTNLIIFEVSSLDEFSEKNELM